MARRSSCAKSHQAAVFRIGMSAARVACGLSSNRGDPLDAPYPGRAGDKSNLKRQGHGIFINRRLPTMVISKRSLFLKYLICIDAIELDYRVNLYSSAST